MSSTVQSLPDGPIDIVGDVHGEIVALRSLIRHLGYSQCGRHPLGRRLVFVGDLINRGPDSPAVVNWVQDLIQSGSAQCVLGNHELNILLGYRKIHNNWFYGQPFVDDQGRAIPQVLADEPTRRRMQELFRTLPLALERKDLRVVHACWDTEMIQWARTRPTDALQLCEHATAMIDADLGQRNDCDEIDRALAHQNRNPVKKLTSGPEERSDVPIHEGRRVRFSRRVPWWNEYSDREFCVFGHYSRQEGIFIGCRTSYCIDFGVGKRWTERRDATASSFSWKLAALRFPEMQIVFDDGFRRPCECLEG